MANTKKYISLDKLGLYDEKIKKFLADADTAALNAAKAYSDSKDSQFDVAGAAATAESNAKAYADGKDAAIQAAADAAAAASAAAGVADGKAVAAQGEVDALEAYVGTFTHDTAKTVVEYVNAKTDGIATSGNLEALAGRVTAVEGDVATVKGDYLKGSDKTELEGKITAANTAVETEKARAEGVEAELRADIDEVMGDYLKASDKTELNNAIALKADKTYVDEKVEALEAADESLQNQINTIMNNPDAEGAINSINEFTAYVAEHGTIADGMRVDINKNKDDIAAMDEAYKAADTAIKGRLDVLEAIDHDAYVAADTALKNELNGEIAKKADATALTQAVETLEGADSAMAGRLDALEAKFTGEDSVEDMIADAQVAAEATAAADATAKANAAEAAAKGHADSLNTAMNTRVEALEAIDHDHANKAELDLIVSGDKAKWDAAAAIAHSHDNKTVLDGITAENVATWNTVTSKAAQADLVSATDRITAIENWHSNFIEVSEEEINGLFA